MPASNTSSSDFRSAACHNGSTDEFESWLFTPPPSIELPRSWEALRSSPCSIMLREQQHYANATSASVHSSYATPPPLLGIRIRKMRVLLFASLFLAVLLILIGVFAHGVALVTLEGVRTDAQQRALVQRYNFYSGTAAALTAKPFELCVATLLPVLYIVCVPKRCLLDDSLMWRMTTMMIYGVFIMTFTSAFSSMYVQPRRPQISPIVVAADLTAIDTSAASTQPDTQSQSRAIDPLQLQSTADTVLRTAMYATFVKSAKSPCSSNGEYRSTTVTHSFAHTTWLSDLLPHGVAPTQSLQLTVGDLVLGSTYANTAAAAAALANRELPIPMATARNLLLHAMLISEMFMPWIPSSFMVNSTYDEFATRTAALNTSKDDNAFLRAAAHMLNESIHRHALYVNYTAAETTLNISRFALSPDITYESVTIDIPLRNKMHTRALYVDEVFGGIKYAATEEQSKLNDAGDAVYDVPTFLDCSIDACVVPDPIFASDTLKRAGRASPTPQIQLFAPCDFGDGSEDVTIDYLHGYECTKQLNTSILVYSIAKRIVADDMVLDPPASYPEGRIGHLVNVRRFHTLTMGRLTWTTHDIAHRFHAVCSVDNDSSSSGCQGLSHRLERTDEGDKPPRFLIVGEQHLPLSAIGPFLGPRSVWMPLVTVATSGTGDLLFKRNVKRFVNWTMDASCSDGVETFAQQVDRNHWYMEHGLQEAYTAALFFLFQHAVVRDEHRVGRGDTNDKDAQRTLNFAGSRVFVTLEAKIPLQSTFAVICGSALLLVAVVVVAVGSKRAEQTIHDGLDAHRVARVLLVDQSFPKLFLECTVDDPEWCGYRKTMPLEHFRIQTLSLQVITSHRTANGGDGGGSAATHPSGIIHLRS